MRLNSKMPEHEQGLALLKYAFEKHTCLFCQASIPRGEHCLSVQYSFELDDEEELAEAYMDINTVCRECFESAEKPEDVAEAACKVLGKIHG